MRLSKKLPRAQKVQDDASTAKKDLEKKEAVADTTKLNKESAEEVKKGEAEIEVAKEVKKAKAKAQAPKPAELEQPWGSPSEVWTANMPSHHLEGYAQQEKKDNVNEHELAQSKAENDEEAESESESESEDEDSGDEQDE